MNSKSEKMRGNTRAKKGEHESLVLRLPVAYVDGLYECVLQELRKQGFFDVNNRMVLDEALRILRESIKAQTGIDIPSDVNAKEEGKFQYLENPNCYQYWNKARNYAVRVSLERWEQEREKLIQKHIDLGNTEEDAGRIAEAELHNRYWKEMKGEGVEVFDTTPRAPVLKFHYEDDDK